MNSAEVVRFPALASRRSSTVYACTAGTGCRRRYRFGGTPYSRLNALEQAYSELYPQRSAMMRRGISVPCNSYRTLLPGIIIWGTGSFTYATMFVAAASGVTSTEQGIASGLADTARQIGSAVGLVALVVAAAIAATLGAAGSRGHAGDREQTAPTSLPPRVNRLVPGPVSAR